METIPRSLPILLDGATGTELYRRGMPQGVSAEAWVLEHPDALLELQRSYLDAGTQVLLTPTFGANRAAMARLMARAGGLSVTLHRAFDMTRDPAAALETAVELGCSSILTSGQAASAAAGAEVLGALVRQAKGRIEIMAGSGVKKETIRDIYRRSGVLAYHTSARRGPVDSGMIYRRAGVSMGLPSLSEYELWRTDEAEFCACAEMVHSLPAG